VTTTPIRCSFLAACAAAVFLAACGRSSPEGSSAAAPAPEPSAADPVPMAEVGIPQRTLKDTPFEFSWDLQMPAPVHATWISRNIPDLVFFQLRNGEVHALDSRSGKTIWATRPLPHLIRYTPYVTRDVIPGEKAGEEIFDDRVYIISDDQLFCLDGSYGQTIYRYHLGRTGKTGFHPASGPLVLGQGDQAKIYINDWEGRVRVVTYFQEKGRAFLDWQWNLYAIPTSSPDGAERIAYVGDDEGVLHAFGLEREQLWEFETKGAIYGAPITRGRSLYLGTDANVLHVLNRLSGIEVGRLVLGSPIHRQPFHFDGEPNRVYVWTEGEQAGLHAIFTQADEIHYRDAENQFPLEVERIEPEWFVPDVNRLVSSSPRHLFVTIDDGSEVLALNRDNGKIDWRWDIDDDRAGGEGRFGRGGPVSGVIEYVDPRDLNRSIFTWDDDGYVVAYRLFGQFD